MPRINIEEKWFSDLRRTRLCELLEVSSIFVDGFWLHAVKLAQQYWIPNKQLIPEKTWNGLEMPDGLFTVGLAEKHENGIYVSGSEEHFAWWFKRREAGRHGGLAKASNAKHCLPKPTKALANLPSSSSSTSTSKTEDVSSAPFLEALKAINDELGTSYRALDANRRLIEPRLAEGSTVQDLVDVARLKKAQWADDAKMRTYLRLKTLYNQTNFENYLSEVKQAKEREAQYDVFR